MQEVTSRPAGNFLERKKLVLFSYIVIFWFNKALEMFYLKFCVPLVNCFLIWEKLKSCSKVRVFHVLQQTLWY